MSDLEAADIDIQHRQPADGTAGLSVFAETSNALLARLGGVAHSANRFAPVGHTASPIGDSRFVTASVPSMITKSFGRYGSHEVS